MKLVRQILKIFCGIIFLCLVTGCDPTVCVRITIDNRSNEPICYEPVPKLTMSSEYFSNFKIKCNSSIPILLEYDPTFKKEKAIYHFLIFKESTINKYSHRELVEQDIYDKRYDLTYDELVAMNFTITYTGD